MALTIRLRPQGRTNRPFYRLVVTEVSSRRDGKYLEVLGWYDPIKEQGTQSLQVKDDRIQFWLDRGAQLSDNARLLVRRAAPDLLLSYCKRLEKRKARLCAKRKARQKRVRSV